MSSKILTISLLMLFSLGRADAQIADSSEVTQLFKKSVECYQKEDYKTCAAYAKEALDIEPGFGRLYIIIGLSYAGSAEECADRLFDKSIIYCLAVDYFTKAKETDERELEEANKLIELYSRYFPSYEELMTNLRSGDKYKIGCWINEETTVRFREDL